MRGTVSGMLNLSRNLGLVTGASLMGAIFASVSGTASAATGMQATFAVGGAMALLALALIGVARRPSSSGLAS
jgi:hypothetical protein